MVAFSHLRLGLTVRNLTEAGVRRRAPIAVALERQARAGVAVLSSTGTARWQALTLRPISI